MKQPRFNPVKAPEGWRVNVPAAYSETNKRERRFFSTKEDADTFAQKLREQIMQHGAGARILPPVQADAALRAFELLGERLGERATPETLVDAVSEYIDRHDMRLASVPFEDAFERFANHQTRSTSYAQSLRQFRARLKSLHGRMLCDITASDLETAMKDFPPTVFNFAIRVLGGLFNFGIKRDLCASNPIKKLDRKKLAPREVEIYSPAEVTALLNASDPSLLPWLTTCMFAGLRASEARKMTWGDFDFTEKFIRVRAAVSKTHRPRAIPMEKNLREWLLPLRKKDSELIAPQGLNVLRSQLRAAHSSSGVRRIKHGPRHSYASYLLARDQNIDVLLLHMGHSNAEVTFRHYHRVATARAAKTFWKLRPAKERKIIPMVATA
jgi:integrase